MRGVFSAFAANRISALMAGENVIHGFFEDLE